MQISDWTQGQAVELKVLAWSSIAQSVCQQAYSLLSIWCLKPWFRILLSADNWSPFDSNIAWLCHSIKIYNNKHVYRQSQVRKQIGSGVERAECSLIIETGCRVQVFISILDSSVSLSAEEDNFPFDSNIACLCQSIEINNNKQVSY